MFYDPNTKAEVSFCFQRSPGTKWLNYSSPAGRFDRCYWLRYQTGHAVKQKQPAYQAVWQLNACHQIQWAQLPVQLIWICLTMPICYWQWHHYFIIRIHLRLTCEFFSVRVCLSVSLFMLDRYSALTWFRIQHTTHARYYLQTHL